MIEKSISKQQKARYSYLDANDKMAFVVPGNYKLQGNNTRLQTIHVDYTDQQGFYQSSPQNNEMNAKISVRFRTFPHAAVGRGIHQSHHPLP